MMPLLLVEIGLKVLVDGGVSGILAYVNKFTGTGRRENLNTAYKNELFIHIVVLSFRKLVSCRRENKIITTSYLTCPFLFISNTSHAFHV
jgi:hypothetical protein